MSGRRSHPRFAVTNPWVGAIKVLRDVVVSRIERDELLAVSNVAAIVGETLSLDLIGDGQAVALKVRVMDSRPVIVDGAVRHRVRLMPLDLETGAGATERTTPERPAIHSPVQRVAEAG
jgi:hypothetical protein